MYYAIMYSNLYTIYGVMKGNKKLHIGRLGQGTHVYYDQQSLDELQFCSIVVQGFSRNKNRKILFIVLRFG